MRINDTSEHAAHAVLIEYWREKFAQWDRDEVDRLRAEVDSEYIRTQFHALKADEAGS